MLAVPVVFEVMVDTGSFNILVDLLVSWLSSPRCQVHSCRCFAFWLALTLLLYSTARLYLQN